MLEEEFSETLEIFEPEALDSEQVALAIYWKKLNTLQKFWDRNIVRSANYTAWFTAISATLGLIGYVVPVGAAFSLLGFISIAATVYAMIFGLLAGVGVVCTGLDFKSFSKMKRNLPSAPDNYTPEMGKLSAGLQVKTEVQNALLLGARALHKNQEDIETDRAQLQGYQLATVKDVYELSEPEGFEQFKLDS